MLAKAARVPASCLLAALAAMALLSVVATLLLFGQLQDGDRAAEEQDGGGAGEGELHFAWVSDCSGYQEWQSLALVWSIYRAQGPETGITRLISGCSDGEREERLSSHARVFPRGPGRRSPELFFTSAYIHNEELNDTYPPYNRPHSIAAWVQSQPLHRRAWVVLLDPDMVMLAPLRLPEAASPQKHLYTRAAPLADALRLPALGQRYKYMDGRWAAAALDLGGVCEAGFKECLELDEEAVAEFYAVGPPWIVRFEDLRRAAPLWKLYTPRIRRQYRKLIAEMYAYSLAFASIGAKHALFDHFVVSYPHAPLGEQAWPWVDGSASDRCGGAPDRSAGEQLPTFLHYCEVYHSEDWYFQKRDVPHKDVLSCRAPLFAEPPEDYLRKRRKGTESDPTDWARQTIRHAWYLCSLLPTLNGAVSAARAALCPESRFNATKDLRVPLPQGEFYQALSDFFKTSR